MERLRYSTRSACVPSLPATFTLEELADADVAGPDEVVFGVRVVVPHIQLPPHGEGERERERKRERERERDKHTFT